MIRRASAAALLLVLAACGTAERNDYVNDSPVAKDVETERRTTTRVAKERAPERGGRASTPSAAATVTNEVLRREVQASAAGPGQVVFADSFCPSYDEACPGGTLGLMSLDGTSKRMLSLTGRAPSFSPDGSKLAFDRPSNACPQGCGDLFVANVDSGKGSKIVSNGRGAAFRPDGSRIAFERKITACLPGSTCSDIWTSAPDGSSQARLVADARSPAWSPDGARIAFVRAEDTKVACRSEVWVADADGSDARQITSASVQALGIAWSPDGTSIAVARHDATSCSRGDKTDYALYVMRADGSNLRFVAASAIRVAWSSGDERLVFERVNCTPTYCPPPELVTVATDGTGKRKLRASTAWPSISRKEKS